MTDCGCDPCREINILKGDPGDDGDPGSNGTFASNGDKYQFNTATGGNPGAGLLLFNNADLTAATSISVNNVDLGTNTMTAWLAALGTSTAAVKGFIRVNKEFDSTKFAIYQVTAVTANVGYYTYTIAYLGGSSASPFLLNDNVIFSYVISGNNGAAGTSGRTVLFNDLTNVTAAATGGVSTSFRTKQIPANTFIANGDSVVIRGSHYNDDQNVGIPGGSTELEFFIAKQAGPGWGAIISAYLNWVAYLEQFVEQITLTRKSSDTLTVEAMTTSSLNRANATVAFDIGAGSVDFTQAIDIAWNVQNSGVCNGFPKLTRMYAEYNPV